jgi:hypothetical protein
MLGNLTFRVTVPILFRIVEQGHHKRLQDHTHIQCAGRTPTARLYGRTPVRYAERIPTRRCVCVTKPKFERWGKSTSRANQVIGLPRTIFMVCG